MTLRETEPLDAPVHEAEENLRIIRDLMERSTRHSTFSGVSGVLAGLVSIAGCLVYRFAVVDLPAGQRNAAFVVLWSAVIAAAIGGDYLLTKRKAAKVGKTIVSRLGKQMALASAPGLGLGAILTLHFLVQGRVEQVFPYWMLCYGAAVSAVGLFSQREVLELGRAFALVGAAAALAQLALTPAAAFELGWVLMGLAFGGFHIVYGIAVSRRDGW